MTFVYSFIKMEMKKLSPGRIARDQTECLNAARFELENKNINIAITSRGFHQHKLISPVDIDFRSELLKFCYSSLGKEESIEISPRIFPQYCKFIIHPLDKSFVFKYGGSLNLYEILTMPTMSCHLIVDSLDRYGKINLNVGSIMKYVDLSLFSQVLYQNKDRSLKMKTGLTLGKSLIWFGGYLKSQLYSQKLSYKLFSRVQVGPFKYLSKCDVETNQWATRASLKLKNFELNIGADGKQEKTYSVISSKYHCKSLPLAFDAAIDTEKKAKIGVQYNFWNEINNQSLENCISLKASSSYDDRELKVFAGWKCVLPNLHAK